jgi:hypothetical protein
MSHPATAISSVKLAWAVSWSAFWTGFPFKVVVALLLLAAQIHPWEGAGLIALLAVSAPIDIWAVGLTARTIFLERLGMEVRGPVGIALWWQGAALGVVMLGVAYYAVGTTATVGHKVAAAMTGVVKKIYPKLPIAEQITFELLIWTIPATIVLIVCLLIWLKLFGWRIKRFAVASGQTTSAGLQERVRQWDYWRVPADSMLMLASFAGVAVLLTVVFWVLLPVTTPHPHEDYPLPPVAKARKPVKPEELLKKTETMLVKAEAVLESLEADKAKEKKKPAGKGK